MSALIENGCAKVNLTLRVVGRRVDGYHDLESVVAFADCADRLTLASGPELRLTASGPRAGECGATADNLVIKAARLLGERVAGLTLGEFTLDKQLPVAAGIGGGSADAAAALRLLARANGLASDDERVIEAARLTGADVPVCLSSRACVMTGVGETLLPLQLPQMPLPILRFYVFPLNATAPGRTPPPAPARSSSERAETAPAHRPPWRRSGGRG